MSDALPLPYRLLAEHRHVTVVGCSATPGKDAHDVPGYLQGHGYEIVPVNPRATAILGVPCVPDLAHAPRPLGLVAVFRPGDQTPPFVAEAARLGAAAVWLPLGVASAESRRIAEAAGVAYVEDRCLRVDHRALHRGG